MVIGVAFMTGSFVLADTLTAQFDRIFTQVNSGKDVVVQPKPAFGAADDGTGTPLDAGLVDSLARVDGVVAAQGGINGMGQLADPAGRLVSGAGPTIVSATATDEEMDSSTYLSGRRPVAAGEVALEKVTVEKLKVQLGDRASLVTPTGKHALTVVGTYRFGRSGGGGALLTSSTAPPPRRSSAAPGSGTRSTCGPVPG